MRSMWQNFNSVKVPVPYDTYKLFFYNTFCKWNYSGVQIQIPFNSNRRLVKENLHMSPTKAIVAFLVFSVHPVPDSPLNDSWDTAGQVRSCDQQFQSYQFLYVVAPISAVPCYVQPTPLVTEGSSKNSDKHFKYFPFSLTGIMIMKWSSTDTSMRARSLCLVPGVHNCCLSNTFIFKLPPKEC